MCKFEFYNMYLKQFTIPLKKRLKVNINKSSKTILLIHLNTF